MAQFYLHYQYYYKTSFKNKNMNDITRGGQFLVKETKCENIFTPEDFSEEQIMMRDMVKEFADKQLWANKR